MAHWNTKKRVDDKRGYKEWTPDAKEKVRKASLRHLQLNDKEWLKQAYLVGGRTTVDIAKEIGCVSSTVYHALNVLGIPRRDRKEAVARREKHYLWKGGISLTKRDTKSPAYRVWRMNVFVRDEYTCQRCGKKGKIQAHHLLSYKDFPDLRFRVDNGMTLCKPCHYYFHGKKYVRKDGELLETLEQTTSSQAEEGILRKVQRLTAEARTAGNADTSAVTRKGKI
jgi:5-methylcytosine-specific restriction endonuclease McrA